MASDALEFDCTLRLAATIMTAHRERELGVSPLTEQRAQLSATTTNASRSPVDNDDDHVLGGRRRKMRKTSPRSVGGGSAHSGTSSGGEEEGGDDDGELDVDAFVAARNNSTRKSPLPAAHELKYLRHEAATLERELRQLCVKWKTHLPDERVLLRACEAAKQKTITMQVERINAELKQQLLQQQLFFSSLQSNLSESPLWSSNKTCQGIFHDVHHELRLTNADEATRSAALRARFEATRHSAPATIDKYTRQFVHSTTPAIPYSQTGTSGTEDYTFLSNVFICKIPNATLCEVFAATIDHFSNLPQQLERHVAMRLTATPICSLGDGYHYSQLEYGSGVFSGVLSNVTFQAELLAEDLAIIVIDFVDSDEMHPHDTTENALRKDGVSMLALTPVVDAQTGQSCILLRRLLVHRYNLPSNSSRLHNEVNSLVPYLNGDLSMAMLCQALQDAKR